LALALSASATSCHRKESNVLVDTVDAKFHVGERWSYRTRPGEEASTLTIVKVEASSALGVVVHVSVAGLHIRSPGAPNGFTGTISHMPFAKSAVEKSVTTLAAKSVPLPAFEDGYAEWRKAKGGVLTSSVAEAVAFIETTINQ
jgi:hypothetical protein